MERKRLRRPWLAGLALALWFGGSPGPALGAEAPAATQQTFSSPSEAARALEQAAKAGNRPALRQLFGPEVTNFWTGNSLLDQKHFEAFDKFLGEGCAAVPDGTNQVTLEIGHDHWPFPIPLVRTQGGWQFDTMAGEEEILNRAIGRNEYFAIGVCRAYVRAQQQYARTVSAAQGSPHYAMRLRSSPGKRDGLFWASEENEPPSPLDASVADAAVQGRHPHGPNPPRPFHGYCFKILKQQGAAAPGGPLHYVQHGQMTAGFALVAYPVRWGQSGIMTFIVNQDGTVYQRSLGEKTAARAAAMKTYNPDRHWTIVTERGITNLEAGAPANKAG